jgi:hypothetical protein
MKMFYMILNMYDDDRNLCNIDEALFNRNDSIEGSDPGSNVTKINSSIDRNNLTKQIVHSLQKRQHRCAHEDANLRHEAPAVPLIADSGKNSVINSYISNNFDNNDDYDEYNDDCNNTDEVFGGRNPKGITRAIM